MARGITRRRNKKLIAWARWIFDAEGGPGISYCKEACGESAIETPCNDCMRPRLLPDNMEAVNVFHACDSQWRFAGNGVRLGLEYSSLLAVMDLRETANRKDVFQKVKTLESEVLSITLKRLNKNDGN